VVPDVLIPRPLADLSRSVARACCTLGLVVSLALAAWATLTPQGTGWRWGDPLTELEWYGTGLGSAATMVQLVGNLALLAAPAAFAVRLWPRLGRPPVLVVTALAAGTSVEALQWLLAIGRVVSPVDALLNAAGAVLAATAVTRAAARTPPRARRVVQAGELL
jgi:hypothetical protein